MGRQTSVFVFNERIDGRKNPKRIKVLPPPGGNKLSDWLNKVVVTTIEIAEHPVGTEATVLVRSHGGSGLTIRFGDGTSAGGVTDSHIRIP
jgi:hypothetical protein